MVLRVALVVGDGDGGDGDGGEQSSSAAAAASARQRALEPAVPVRVRGVRPYRTNTVSMLASDGLG